MTRRRSSRSVASLSALLQGITALFFHGLILCVGPGGHAAVEWFADDDCCPTTSATSFDRDRCCDCTDAPLLQPIAENRDAGEQQRAVTSIGLPTFPSFEVARAAISRPPGRVLAPPGDPLTRRSIVLQV